MENSNQIVPPHLNAEVYRTFNSDSNLTSYQDYIRIHSDGTVLVGSSELTGRHWNGEAGIYKTVTEAQKLPRDNKKSIWLTSGTADGYFVESSNKVLLCEDTGAVSVWNKNDGEHVWQEWTEEVSVAEHDDAALAVDCLLTGKEYVTAGADGNIKVWDVSTMVCMRNYANAHNRPIYGVSVQPQSNTNFASGSMDKYLTLWDENFENPALDLFNNDCCIRCLNWINTDQLIFGDEAGTLKLIDVRKPDVVTKLAEFPAAVHKLAVHTDCSKVAVCCDNKIVSVCEITEDGNSKMVYHDRHMHSNLVRCLAWDIEDKDILHAVGWDGEVKTHCIG